MFQEGKIKTYNEDRGFGFIQIEGQSKDLFFHVKDFPNKNIPPKMGEKLEFLIGKIMESLRQTILFAWILSKKFLLHKTMIYMEILKPELLYVMKRKNHQLHQK